MDRYPRVTGSRVLFKHCHAASALESLGQQNLSRGVSQRPAQPSPICFYSYTLRTAGRSLHRMWLTTERGKNLWSELNLNVCECRQATGRAGEIAFYSSHTCSQWERPAGNQDGHKRPQDFPGSPSKFQVLSRICWFASSLEISGEKALY